MTGKFRYYELLIFNKMKKVLFISILLLAAVLRFYNISNIPPGVNRDEASIGYTAYSLLHTGKDEYGRSFPFSFESFGDWKLPFYIYENMVSVSIFGLNEFAVRVPSALAGIATVALVFFLAEELFHTKRVSYLAMLLTAIAPWSIHLSRVGAETNTAVLLVTAAMLLFLKSLKGMQWLLIPSAVCFALSYFTYAGNYVFTTLLGIGLFFFYKNAVKRTKYLWTSLAIFFVLAFFIWYQTTSANHTKLSGISIFGDPSVVHAQIEIPRNEHVNPSSLFTKLVHNKIVFGGERFLQNYTNTFSASFLFINGGTNHAHNIKNFGNMYIVESLFLFLGLVYLIALKRGKEKNLVLWWFFISPIAASITKDAPHTTRTYAIFPILPLVVAFGIWWFFSCIQKKYKYPILAVVLLLFILNITLYLDRYYVHFPRDESDSWGFPYRSLNDIITQKKFQNMHIIITQPQTSPYIYLLFYQKYDPVKYQQSAQRYPPTDDGFVHVKSFDRYEFRDIDWNKDIHDPNTLLVDVSSNVPDSIKINYASQDVILPNGKSIFTIIETK